MHKIIKFKWQNEVFIVDIPVGTISIYLHALGISTNNIFEETLAIYNLANLIKTEFMRIFTGITFVGIMPATTQLENQQSLDIDLTFTPMTQMRFRLFANNITEISNMYYAAKINLEKIYACENAKETVYNKYHLTLLREFSPAHTGEHFIACKIHYNNNFEYIYFSVAFAEYIYNKRYPHYIPFVSNNYHLTLIANILNLWFVTVLKIHDVTVIAISLVKIPVKKYNAVIIKSNNFSNKIFFAFNSPFLIKLKANFTTKIVIDHEAEAKIMPSQQKINFNLIKGILNLTLQQLKNIKVNDIILFAPQDLRHEVKIAYGKNFIQADILDNNKIVITTVN